MTYHNRFRVLFDVTQSYECEININTEGGISNNGGTAWIWWNCVVICLKIRTFVVSATTVWYIISYEEMLWFAWKFVPLWYQQQLLYGMRSVVEVVICLKIRTFVVSATTASLHQRWTHRLWFAWKFVPLWYQQQHKLQAPLTTTGCDLLENSYLCGISNNYLQIAHTLNRLWFAWKFVPLWYQQQPDLLINGVSCSCDLLENSYLCGVSNNRSWIIYWLA